MQLALSAKVRTRTAQSALTEPDAQDVPGLNDFSPRDYGSLIN